MTAFFKRVPFLISPSNASLPAIDGGGADAVIGGAPGGGGGGGGGGPAMLLEKRDLYQGRKRSRTEKIKDGEK